jgi:hypothetical protein
VSSSNTKEAIHYLGAGCHGTGVPNQAPGGPPKPVITAMRRTELPTERVYPQSKKQPLLTIYLHPYSPPLSSVP